MGESGLSRCSSKYWSPSRIALEAERDDFLLGVLELRVRAFTLDPKFNWK